VRTRVAINFVASLFLIWRTWFNPVLLDGCTPRLTIEVAAEM